MKVIICENMRSNHIGLPWSNPSSLVLRYMIAALQIEMSARRSDPN